MGSSSSGIWTVCVSSVSPEEGCSGNPVQHFVVRAGEGQKPGPSVIEAERRTGEGNSGEWNLVLAAGDLLRNFRSQIRGHRHPVTRIPQCVADAINFSGVWHGIETEVEGSSPGEFDFCVLQLRKHLDHIVSQNF